jgi:PAS domain S-box-containing protein
VTEETKRIPLVGDRQAESATHVGEFEFRSLLEKLPAGAYTCNPEGLITYFNQHAVQLWGRAPRLNDRRDRFCGSFKLFSPDGSPIAHDQCWMALALKNDKEYNRREIVVERPDGKRLTALAHANPIHDESGRLLGAVNVLVDISDRKRDQEEIETRARQQAIIADLGRRALTEPDLSALMEVAVETVAHTLGVEYSEVLELLPEGDALLLRAGVGWKEGLVGQATVGAGLGSQAGYTLVTDGPVVVDDLRAEKRFSGPPLLHEHEVVSGMSVIIRGREGPFGVLGAHTKGHLTFTENDVNFLRGVANVLAITIERKEAEEALHEVREAERQRMARDLHDEALQDLTYALTEAQLVQKLSQNPELNSRLERLAGTLKRAGQGLRGAIYDPRLEEQDREQSFTEQLEALVELYRRRHPDTEIELSIELSIEGDFAPPLSKTAEAELLRIVREALNNAHRHSEAGCIRVALGASGGKLWTKISDDGRGFDPARTAVGMGTKGMRERARKLGGDLRIESKPGEGSTVLFELAVRTGEEGPEEEVRILLVEDHTSFRQALASVLGQEQGFSIVAQAGSLSEAREVLSTGVDVAIVDLGLPDGYGGELIKELRETNPQAQVLVLSASLERPEVARAVESGAAGVLHKSTGLDQIVEAVRRLKMGQTLVPLGDIVELMRFASSRREEEYEARQAIARLTPREREVLHALADGLNTKEIADRLCLSVTTARNHLGSIFAKLEVHSQLQALVFALRYGLVDIS